MVKSWRKDGIIHKKLVLMPARESWRNVGHKIRYLRKADQLTIKQLAAGSGLSANAISLVERGEVAPTVETLCKVAR
jgi:DNA-binding XRE family transcriptional regulator